MTTPLFPRLLLLSLLLTGCLGGASAPPLAEKGEASRQKAARLFRECRTGLALSEYRKVLYLAELRDDRPAIASALLNLGVIQLVRGDWQEAEIALRLAAQRYLQLNDHPGRQEAESHLATVQIKQGRHHEGLQALQQLWQQLATEPASPLRVRILNGMAIAHKSLGQLEEAQQALLQAEQESDASANRTDLATVRMNRARLLLQQGALPAAQQQANSALELDRAAEHLLGIGADLLLLGVISERQGEKAQAQSYWRQAASIWEYCGLDRQRIFAANGIADPLPAKKTPGD
ncbi:MAG: tetratricopeptide repeat protein [Magnetococcales bacterium]|nr:tetratricopeptide repeat protein [Magnetococcales bacterium]